MLATADALTSPSNPSTPARRRRNHEQPARRRSRPGTSYADITREFDAPVEALFRAHADPELSAQWIGPGEERTEITEWDFRTGGGYRFVQRDADGEYGFRGVFHTIRENELIIQTFEYEGWPDEVSIDAMRFEALAGGRSRIVDRSVFPSVEVLENMVSRGHGAWHARGLRQARAAPHRRGADMGKVGGLDILSSTDSSPTRTMTPAGCSTGTRSATSRSSTASEPPSFHLTPTSAEFWRGLGEAVGCLVVGRLLFDITDGWSGEHPLGVPFVVLTHEAPADWAHGHTGNAHFVTDGIESASRRRRRSPATATVALAAGTIAGQALGAGLVDEVAVDLVPVVLGSGHRYFADVDPAAVRLGDPTTIIPSARVTHMVFPVER